MTRRMMLTVGIVGLVVITIVGYLVSRPTSIRDTVSLVDFEMGAILITMEKYYREFGKWPSLESYARTLNGENDKGRMFLNVDKNSINEAGKMLDPWRSPYEVKVEGTRISVVSAGPDQQFGTGDDRQKSRVVKEVRK